jgi:hypothetical protein
VVNFQPFPNNFQEEMSDNPQPQQPGQQTHESEHQHKHHHHHHHHHGHQSDEVRAREAQLLTSLDCKNIVHIVDSPLDLAQISKQVSSTKAGAIATFCGTTRDHHNGKTVLRLEYEAYIPMAEKEMLKICDTIRQKWQVRPASDGMI